MCDRLALRVAAMKYSIFDTGHLESWLQERQQSGFRFAQIRRWLLDSHIESIDHMSDLSKSLRTELAEAFDFWSTRLLRRQTSSDGTDKLLLQLSDGGTIECVLLRDGVRRTICLSSQVGCAMGCVFLRQRTGWR